MSAVDKPECQCCGAKGVPIKEYPKPPFTKDGISFLCDLCANFAPSQYPSSEPTNRQVAVFVAFCVNTLRRELRKAKH